MSEPHHDNPFPALERAKRLSDFLCEGDLDEFTPTPEEEEAAHRLQQDLVKRLRTVHHSQWPRPEVHPRTVTHKENQPKEALGITAP